MSQGSWWRKAYRQKVDFASIPLAFVGLCEAFPSEIGLLNSAKHREDMQWLCDNVQTIAAAIANAPPRTVVHGDAKAANAFFRVAGGGSDAGPDVTLIDFQWTGFAPSGAADVVYAITGSVQPSVLLAGPSGEARLLDAYHAQLRASLPHCAAAEYTRASFQRDYELELLDYATTALPYLLAGLTPALAEANRGKHGWLTHEYDPRATGWFVRRVLRAVAAVRPALQAPPAAA